MCKLTVSAAVFHELARCAGFEFCLVRFFLAELAHDMGSLLSLFDDAADALMLEVAKRGARARIDETEVPVIHTKQLTSATTMKRYVAGNWGLTLLFSLSFLQ
jgi:hypothetical protein